MPVNPGHIVTDRLRRRVETYSLEKGMTTEEAQEALCVEHGIWRFGSAEEVAQVIAFMCSPAGAYINGATVDVDGGGLSWHLNGAASAMSAPPTVALVARNYPHPHCRRRRGMEWHEFCLIVFQSGHSNNSIRRLLGPCS